MTCQQQQGDPHLKSSIQFNSPSYKLKLHGCTLSYLSASSKPSWIRHECVSFIIHLFRASFYSLSLHQSRVMRRDGKCVDEREAHATTNKRRKHDVLHYPTTHSSFSHPSPHKLAPSLSQSEMYNFGDMSMGHGAWDVKKRACCNCYKSYPGERSQPPHLKPSTSWQPKKIAGVILHLLHPNDS